MSESAECPGHELGANFSSSVAEFVEIIFIHSEMMPDLVQDGFSNFLDQFCFTVEGDFVVLLEKRDPCRHPAGMLDASLGERNAFMKSKKELVVCQADRSELLEGRTIPDFDRHLFDVAREGLGKLAERLLDQLAETRFAHVISHGVGLNVGSVFEERRQGLSDSTAA